MSSQHNLFCARYGGDEFILVKSGDSHFDSEDIGVEINKRLKQICEEQKKEYVLSVSAGYYTSTDSSESVASVIRNADKKLYAAKKRRG